MTPRVFMAGWLVSAALLSSWAVSSASDQGRPARPAATPPRPGAAVLPALSVELSEQIERLAARADAMAAAVPARRDLFAFRDRAARPAAAKRPAVTEAVVVDAPPMLAEAPPQPSLAGIADLGAGGLTAVVSLRDVLHYVKKGDVIDGRYRVDAVGFDSVDVFDLTLGTILRLSWQL